MMYARDVEGKRKLYGGNWKHKPMDIFLGYGNYTCCHYVCDCRWERKINYLVEMVKVFDFDLAKHCI